MTNEEWHQWRRGGLGSSDAAVVMGVSPWRTPYQLWQDKVYGNSVQFENPAMTRGKELEPVARSWFEKAMNVAVFPKNKTHPEKDFIRASLDGIDVDNKVMVEIKCPNKEDHFVALNKKVPEKYVPQLQHQLLVTGLDGMYYVSFDGSEGAIVEIARDNAYIASMLEEEQKFWDLVLAKKAPELTERDFIPMEDNHEWKALATRWLENKQVLDKAEELDQHIRQIMVELSDDHSSVGHGVKTCKSTCQGPIDYKKIMADFPDIAWESYRKKPVTKWTFRATG